MRFFKVLGIILLCSMATMSYAQDSDYEEVFMPELFPTSVTIDSDEEPPKEPNLYKVEFLEMPSLNSLDERINRLIQGISMDIAPEYDHYGYEIRRYMARVGNTKVLEQGQDEYLIEQIKNTRKARVIAEYWKKHLEKEMDEIQTLLQGEGVSFSTKTAFKQNTNTVNTFLISLMAWIDANENVLMNVFDHPGVHDLIYPEVFFAKPHLRIEYYNLMAARAQKLKDITEYRPFALMVY